MSIVLDGNLGITSPAETVQGALTTTGNTILGDASTDTLNVGNGGLVKDASGNVGIGTSGPNVRLHIKASASTFISFAQENTNGGTDAKIVDWLNNGNTYSLRLVNDAYNAANSAYSVERSGYTVLNQVWYTGSSTERMRIDSSGNLLFNSGYGSAATAYGCRAWVNFNGTGTPAIRASGNVSSITDGGVGLYTVNFTTAMVDINYSTVISYSQDYGVARCVGAQLYMNGAGTEQAPTTSAAQFKTTSAAADYDAKYVCVSVFR